MNSLLLLANLTADYRSLDEHFQLEFSPLSPPLESQHRSNSSSSMLPSPRSTAASSGKCPIYKVFPSCQGKHPTGLKYYDVKYSELAKNFDFEFSPDI